MGEGSTRLGGWKRLFPAKAPLPFFLGLTFLFTWTQLLYSSKVLLLPPGNLLPLSITHLFSTFAAIALNVVIVLVSRRVTPLQLRREALHFFGILGAVATCGIPFVSAGIIGNTWMFACVFLTATSGTWLAIAWYEQFAAQGVRGALLCYAACTVLSAPLSLLISLLPQSVGVVFTVLLPILATFSLRTFPNPVLSATADAVASRPTFKTLLSDTPLRLILVVGIVSFAMGAIRTLSLPNDPALTPMGEWLASLTTGALALIIAGLFAFLSYRVNPAIAFYIAIPAIALTSLLLIAPLELPGALLGGITTTGTNLVNILVWLVLINAVIEKHLPAAWCFGLLGAFQFTGTLLGQLTTIATGSNLLVIAFVLLIVLIAAALVALGAQRSLVTLGSAPRDIECQANALADARGLSPREREVLLIWVSGHNSAHIEQALSISKNTVKTHLSHIYVKTETASREELLTLVEKTEVC